MTGRMEKKRVKGKRLVKQKGTDIYEQYVLVARRLLVLFTEAGIG